MVAKWSVAHPAGLIGKICDIGVLVSGKLV